MSSTDTQTPPQDAVEKINTDPQDAAESQAQEVAPTPSVAHPLHGPISEEADEAPAEPAAPFRALGLSEPLMRAIVEAGFEAPTPIQAQAIPLMLVGNDLIGQAQTGTGKTAAFALPLAERLDPAVNETQAIVLLPTRELCIQVAEEVHALSKYRRLRVVAVYGGQPIDRQFRALRTGAHIVVGTPGRVLDHLRRGTLDLTKVRAVVLDEADEMLNMGFIEDVEEILKDSPKERQTALFSATMPPRIAALARDYLKEPSKVSIEAKKRTVAQIEQSYYEVPPARKVEALTRILDMESPGSTIIFCRTRREVDELGEALRTRGYEAETLHGELNQAARDRVMQRFRSNQADILIATDVAARGLDIDQVTHVINYDIPWDVESYIHRIGRTGRAGRSGDAITLISPRERFQLRTIERHINARIEMRRVPTSADVAARRRDVFQETLRRTLEEGNYDGFLAAAEELASDGTYDFAQIAAAAMQMLWQSQKGGEAYQIAEAEAEGERPETGMARIFVQVGRIDGVRPGDIVGAIANEAGLPGSAIGAIDIMDRSTFVEVPESEAQNVIAALNSAKLKGRRLYADLARPREQGGGEVRPGGDRDDRRPNDFAPRREFGRGGNGGGGFRRDDDRSGGYRHGGPPRGPRGPRPPR